MNYRKFRKNAKALSPVIATIILIAVTVAVSVVVAAWMGALTIGFMGNSEQASITNTQYVSSTVVNATVQNTGSATVTIVGAYIDGKAVAFVGYPAGSGTASSSIAKGTTSVFELTSGSAFVNTAQYTLKLMTAKGNAVTTTYTYSGS
jgi:flagellin-like protein